MIMWVITTHSFYFIGTQNSSKTKQSWLLKRLFASMTPALSSEQEDDKNNLPSVDFDFAEAISKPLPKWYRDSKAEKEFLRKEIEKTREQIIKDFKSKFDIPEDQKQKERERKWAKIQKQYEEKQKQKQSLQSSPFGKLIAFMDRKSISQQQEEEEVVDAIATTENWEKLLAEEEEKLVNLPNFFDLFPELQFKWPKWATRRDGSMMECDTDKDCPVPLTCCTHPIVPGPKFCCSGWGQRMMVPAYVREEILANRAQQNSGGNREEGKDEGVGGYGRFDATCF
jgi:hypothetical protein